MAKLIGPALSLTASGSLKKKIVFQRTPSGHKIYIDHSHKGIVTDTQTARRNLFLSCIVEWKALSSSEKSSYNDLAKGKQMTGYNYFIQQCLMEVVSVAPAGEFVEATGGSITYDGDYKVHTFLTSSEFVVTNGGLIEYLLVGGGGAGGGQGGESAGGGGAGGIRHDPEYPVTIQTYTVTIGEGGEGVVDANGENGEDSVFGPITAIGGGGGGGGPSGSVGENGGSGGGGSKIHNGGTGTEDQGYDGGNSTAVTGGGGGGGGGEKGHNNTTGPNTGGIGGFGLAFDILEEGSDVYYGGGGGGGGDFGGDGGNGGGGHGGGYFDEENLTAGTPNTGGGGGGHTGRYSAGSGAKGGSGILIIRYKYK